MHHFKKMFANEQGLSAMRVPLFLILTIFSGLILSELRAQSYQWISLSDMDSQIVLSDSQANTGDTIWIEVHLDTGNPANHTVYGLNLEFELSNTASLPNGYSIDLSNSWLFGGVAVDSSTAWDPTTRELMFQGLRADSSGQSGSGQILRFPLICLEDGIQAETLLANHGGLVLIENLDMLKMSAQVPKTTTVYRLEQGKWHLLVPNQALTPGMHILKDCDSNGEIRIRKVLVR